MKKTKINPGYRISNHFCTAYEWVIYGLILVSEIKATLKEILQTDYRINIYRQRYDKYINNPDNDKKCEFFNICNNNTEVYDKKMYLTEIESSYIRSIFTKLRIDMKWYWDSKNHSFQNKNVTSNICTSSNQVQNVDHVLLHCNHPVLSDNRETFQKLYCQYVKHFSVNINHN